MCGFAGFYDGRGRFYTEGRSIVKEMSESILHRGPDSRGEFSDKIFSVGFNRLKIIDLDGGDQPMLSADGRYVICFNGEIYNYRSLRTELTEKYNVRFRTDSDTEVLLNACIVYGREALSRLRGMYSFVLYDRKERTLFAARDPFGIKPFYYGIFDGALLFASEIKALFSHPLFKKELNADVLPYYLQFQYVPTEETAFKGVSRLLPGHLLTYSKDTLCVSKYFTLPKGHGSHFTPYTFFDSPVSTEKAEISLSRAADSVFTATCDSVKAHLVSDVPVGAFLSGGVDSALITAIAKPQTAFTVGFNDSAFDERRAAAETALHVGTALTSVEVSADEFFEALPKVQYHSDEPYANLSAVPLYLIAKRASADVKVILSGEGADELFGGYDLYAEGLLQRLYKKLPFSVRRFILRHSECFGKRMRDFTERNLPRTEDSFIGQARIMSPAEAYLLLSKEYRSLKNPTDVTAKYYRNIPHGSDLQKKTYLDLSLWMPYDILNKADKMTMASSLEMRVPYLDLNVLSASERLQDRLCVKGRSTKRTLRKAAGGVLPENIVFRPKKGFPVPFRDWIKEERYAERLTESFSGETARRFFDTERLSGYLHEHVSGKENRARILYTAYAFIIWYDRFFSHRDENNENNTEVNEDNEKERDKATADTARL